MQVYPVRVAYVIVLRAMTEQLSFAALAYRIYRVGTESELEANESLPDDTASADKESLAESEPIVQVHVADVQIFSLLLLILLGSVSCSLRPLTADPLHPFGKCLGF